MVAECLGILKTTQVSVLPSADLIMANLCILSVREDRRTSLLQASHDIGPSQAAEANSFTLPNINQQLC